MKVLIVEDDFTCRKFMQGVLSDYGDCDVAINGEEAVEAFKMAWAEGKPYDLICLDIMMPNMDGHEALAKIRGMEKEMGITNSTEVKVFMTTALGDPKNVMKALYKEGATSYLVKPVGKQALIGELSKFGFTKK